MIKQLIQSFKDWQSGRSVEVAIDHVINKPIDCMNLKHYIENNYPVKEVEVRTIDLFGAEILLISFVCKMKDKKKIEERIMRYLKLYKII